MVPLVCRIRQFQLYKEKLSTSMDETKQKTFVHVIYNNQQFLPFEQVGLIFFLNILDRHTYFFLHEN